MARPRKIVIGQYHCGCTYGPIWIRERLNYCGRHGENIQCEYDVTAAQHPLHPDAGDSGEKLEADPANAPAQVS